MFFRKKDRRDESEELLRNLAEDIKRLGGQFQALRETQRDILQEEGKEAEKRMRRQAESLEDLLEEFQEAREEQETAQRLLKDCECRERELLAMASFGREQMQLLEAQILKDSSMNREKRDAWAEQFAILNQEYRKRMCACGMEEVGAVGERLDYDIHEVLALVKPEEAQQSGTVAEVFCRGRYYHGRLIKKAQVAAYRKTDGEESVGAGNGSKAEGQEYR